MLEILGRAAALVAIVGIGWGLKRTGLLRHSDFRVLSVLLLWVTLPGALLTAFDGQVLDPSLLLLTGIAAAVNTLLQAAAWWQTRTHGRRDQAFAVLNAGSFNIGAFATPYLAGMLGPAAMIPTTMFDIGGALTSAGSGYAWGMSLAEPAQPGRARRVLRTLAASPVLITFAALITLALTGTRLPAPILAVTSTAGAANPFVAMMLIGVALEIRLPAAKYAMAARSLAVRYLIAGAAALACWWWLPLPADIRLITTVLFFSPMATMLSAFTAKAELDVELSTFMTSVTILISIVAMPALLFSLH